MQMETTMAKHPLWANSGIQEQDAATEVRVHCLGGAAPPAIDVADLASCAASVPAWKAEQRRSSARPGPLCHQCVAST